MPPERTIPPVKAVKSERTHEENQERAYIAASRRSDRSLEARVESARRASEIHKRRTGRSLRVTEQDVINEEMYEEEDDDLPLAYRRLTAHLQTNSADFNQRLNAYITNQVAMRSALERSIAITNMNGGSAFLKTHQPLAMSSAYTSPIASTPTTAPSPTTAYHRQAPYPSPRPPQKSMSVSAASSSLPDPPPSERRISLPVPAPTEKEARPTQRHRPSFDAGSFSQVNYPFTMSLPAESQMLLGSSFAGSSDPLMAHLMSGSTLLPQAEQFGYTSTAATNPPPDAALGHLQDTLAPSMFQGTPDWDFNMESEMFRDQRDNTDVPSAVNNEPWGDFIDTDQWELTDAGAQPS